MEVNNSTANHVVEMLINGVSVGEITLDQHGGSELQLDARNGDKILSVQAKDVIEVLEAEHGTVLLTGQFVAK